MVVRDLEFLVVEDSRTQAELLRSILEEHGGRVILAYNARQALAAVRERTPALIIADIEMPEMNGYELCRAIKQDPSLRHVPVILLTSLSDPTDVLRGLEAGADYYLTKPFDRDLLVRRLEEILFFPTRAHQDRPGQPLEVFLEGERHVIASPPAQILNLLLSTYSNAVQRNQELIRAQNELVWLNHELTEQAARLRQSEERYRSVVEQTNEGICLIDLPSWRVIESNAALQSLLGYSADELELMNFAELAGASAADLQAWLDQVSASERSVVQEKCLPSRGGGRIDVELSASVIHLGERRVLCCIIRDIRERKRAAVELEQARQAADAASQAKGRFLAHMSHEIRTPLNGILGIAELLRGTGLTEQQVRYVDMIASSGEMLAALVNDVLDFSKIEAGRLDLIHAPFPLHETVEDVLEVLAQAAARKGLELASHFDPAVPSQVIGDGDRLRQIIVNLVNNAIKFTGSGGVSVSVSLDSSSDEAVVVRFAVNDTGIGILPEDLDRLFKVFSQIDSSATRKHGGSGLGLVISKRLTELMGGDIGVESQPGVGSTFWFTARFKRVPADASPDDPAAPGQLPETLAAGVLPSDLSTLRVLVAEDSETVREALGQQIRSWGPDAALAESGHQSLEMLRAAARSGRPFQVAIIDQTLPDISGVDLAARIRSERALEKTVLMFLAGIELPADADTLRRQGFSGVMTKPVRQSSLFDSIVSAIASASGFKTVRRAGTPATSQTETVAKRGNARILLAEDNEVNQIVAQGMLEQAGYACDVVATGSEVLRALEQRRYDVIVMDCQMPEMDGFETTQRIRDMESAAPGRRRVPIIALTANAIKGDRERCLASGMDAYISKPVRPQALVAAVETCLAEVTEATSQCGSAGEVIGIDGFLERCMHQARIAQIALDKFEEQLTTDLERLTGALRNADTPGLARLAHALKGAAGMVCADRLQQLAAELEETAGRDARERLAAVVSEVQAEMRRCLDDLPRARHAAQTKLAGG